MLNDKPKHIMHGKHIYSLLDFINFNFNGDEPNHPIILKLEKKYSNCPWSMISLSKIQSI
jgi:hypothetical protein